MSCTTSPRPSRTGRSCRWRRRHRGSGARSGACWSSMRAWSRSATRPRVACSWSISAAFGMSRDSGRPGIFVAPHLANWNLLPIAAVPAGIPLSVVYRRQSNPAIEELMTSWRAALGCGFLEVGEASRGMLRELQQGRSVGLLMDQRYDRGEKLPFFGVPATTTMVPGACRPATWRAPDPGPDRAPRRRALPDHRASPSCIRARRRGGRTGHHRADQHPVRPLDHRRTRPVAVPRGRWPRPRPYLPGGGKVSTT